MAEIQLPIKPPTRDQLSRMAGGNQEMIRKLEMLFQQAGEITPDQVVVLLQLTQEAQLAADNAISAATEALAQSQAALSQIGLLLNLPSAALAPDDLSPRAELGTIASQNADNVEVGELAATGNIEAASYSVNGNPGASGTGTVISDITVENGIITSITVA